MFGLPCPHDIRSIDVRLVINPLLVRIVSRFPPHQNEMLSRFLVQPV